MERKSSWGEYDPQSIEKKWQRIWDEQNLYRTGEDSEKEKYYCLDFFPYPSGEGLHVGHCRNYVPTDLVSRYKRMNGYNVLHPMGWDAFGEPTEQHAILHGIHPREITDRNAANFRRQLKSIGTSYDWSREIDSSNPDYYRWNQWFFLQFYHHGLVYRDKNWQWWCPVCQTSLSSHEIQDGKCWRGHDGVTRKEIPAWYFKITHYADELLAGLDQIDWPEPVKAMQRNWIGRSEGALITFKNKESVDIPVFTTRPDTLFGASFLAVSPENPIIPSLTKPGLSEDICAYLEAASRVGLRERLIRTRQLSGVFTGSFVTNPVTQEPIPVWIADYVLPDYGTGAIMGVPAHDQTDWEFAQKYGLRIRQVIDPIENKEFSIQQGAYTGQGYLINSGRFNGYKSEDAFFAITEWLKKRNKGRKTISYRMHDWLISRQRYWGTPIPIIYCDTCGEVPIPEDQLPLLLPEIKDFSPDGSGRSPLAKVDQFVNVKCPVCSKPAKRETDTMGGFACSSWYFLRFTSPRTSKAPFDKELASYWMPVDLYVGGAEHAVLHLLYARFWIKALADFGLIDFREPFKKYITQGQLMGSDDLRMSKSRGNVITPDSVVDKFGADALRVFELFMAPFEQNTTWSDEGINGSYRFLKKLWDLYQNTYEQSSIFESVETDIQSELQLIIKEATSRIETFKFNTLISLLMEFSNTLVEVHRNGRWQNRSFHESLSNLLLLLAPITPHFCEEIWHLTGHTGSIHSQTWPEWSQDKILESMVDVPVQIDGKVRAVLSVEQGLTLDELKGLALSEDRIINHLVGKEVLHTYFVQDKVLNLVTTR